MPFNNGENKFNNNDANKCKFGAVIDAMVLLNRGTKFSTRLGRRLPGVPIGRVKKYVGGNRGSPEVGTEEGEW